MPTLGSARLLKLSAQQVQPLYAAKLVEGLFYDDAPPSLDIAPRP